MDLTELFDKHYDYEHHSTPQQVKNGDHHYSFNTQNKDGSKGENYKVHILHHLHDEKSAAVAFVDSNRGFNNNGSHSHDSHKVLGTVKKILKDHAEKHGLHSYTFSAEKEKDHGSRADVYTKMARGHSVKTSKGYFGDHTREIEVSTKKMNEEQGKMKNTYGLSQSIINAVKTIGEQSTKTLEEKAVQELQYKLDNGYIDEEELTEISRKLVKSYMKKSDAEMDQIGKKHDDNVLKIKDSEDGRKFYNRRSGHILGWSKTTTRKGALAKVKATTQDNKQKKTVSEENIDEISKCVVNNYLKSARKQINDSDSDSDDRTVGKRQKGHALATKKKYGSSGVVAASESEQIDEISKDKASRYVVHAAHTAAAHASQASSFHTRSVLGKDPYFKDQDKKDSDRHEKSADKRLKGVKTAAAKLGGHAKVNATESLSQRLKNILKEDQE